LSLVTCHLSLWLFLEPARADDEAPPEPWEEGGFGPVWVTDAGGALQPELALYAEGSVELYVEGRLYLGPGSVVSWSQGPYTPGEGLVVSVDLPSGVGSTLAAVRVRLVAKEAGTGRELAFRSAARVWVHQGASEVVWSTEAQARTLADISSLSSDGMIEEGLVGREVSP
jgi:hypothetical protein